MNKELKQWKHESNRILAYYSKLESLRDDILSPKIVKFLKISFLVFFSIILIILLDRYMSDFHISTSNLEGKAIMSSAVLALVSSAVISVVMIGPFLIYKSIRNAFLFKKRKEYLNTILDDINYTITDFCKDTQLSIEYFNEIYLGEILDKMSHDHIDFDEALQYFNTQRLDEQNFQSKVRMAKKRTERLKTLDTFIRNNSNINSSPTLVVELNKL